MFGEKEFGKNEGYPTPEETPSEMSCLVLRIPADPAWWAVYSGLLYSATFEKFWQQFEGGQTREQAAHCAKEIYDQAMQRAKETNTCPTDGVPTPYWDEDSDLEDELPESEQVWYGEVADPEAPADELSFIDNAAIWALTGFIAYSGEIGGAIFFHTIAPSFMLAWRRGDVGEVIRVVIDSAEYGRVDTTSASVGDVVNLPVIVGDGGHDILMMKVS